MSPPWLQLPVSLRTSVSLQYVLVQTPPFSHSPLYSTLVTHTTSPIPMSWKPLVPSSLQRPGHLHMHAHATESAVGASSAVAMPSKDRLCSHKGEDRPPTLPCHHGPPSRLRVACPPFHATMPLLLSFACHLPALPCHHGPPSLVLLAILNSIYVGVWVRRPRLCGILHLTLHHCRSERASHSICWTVTYDDRACPRQQHLCTHHAQRDEPLP